MFCQYLKQKLEIKNTEQKKMSHKKRIGPIAFFPNVRVAETRFDVDSVDISFESDIDL